MASVSVVIPTFNREQFIEKSVISALKQTKKPNEIIVVDDGSTDQTWNVLKQLGFSKSTNKNISLRYIYQKNKGVSAARNLGIEASKYSFIALLDSDDIWLKQKLERQMTELMQQKDTYRLSHTEEIWVRNGVRLNAKKKYSKSGGDIFKKCLRLCCISPSSSLIERSVFDDFWFFDESLLACEDYDFWLRYCAYEKVHFVDERLIIKNGGHSDQLSSAHWGLDRYRIYALEKLLHDRNLNPSKHRKALEEVISRLEILINGALKRNKNHSAQALIRKQSEWKDLLTNETGS